MHLVTIIFILFAAWRWSDWRNWQKYHPTMLYFAMSNLLYNFIYYNHLLWRLKPDFLFNHVIGELFYTFIVFPLTALLFLSAFPESFKGKILRITKFIIIYIAFEWIFLITGRMVHSYGWNMWWSLAWDCMMFPVLLLHHTKPLLSYVVSLVTVVIVVLLFPPNFY